MYAHYDKATGQKQLLQTHLFNVAKSAATTATIIGQQDILFLLGLYHDVGKSKKSFQNKLKYQLPELVNHSSAGAKYLFDQARPTLLAHLKDEKHLDYAQLFLETICYVITAHHGVYDIPIDKAQFFNSKLYERVKYDEYNETRKYNYERDVLPFTEQLEQKLLERYEVTLEEVILKAFHNYYALWLKLEPKDKSEENYYSGLMVRLYLSLLKNADILDTVNAYSIVVAPKSDESILALKAHYLNSIEEEYEKYNTASTPINLVRNTVARAAFERGKTDSPGIYRLDLPTGAGKTKVSLRYGIHQMARKNKRRFFYIAPYLSILEQNAAVIKSIIGTEGVLEHHSNIINSNKEEDEEQEDTIKASMQEYLMETWDSPIVLSSMVQLFQTLFKVKSSNIRRFSNLINSTIVFDEVQSLPARVMTLYNLTMNFLSRAMAVNVVLCTATQPNYDSEAIKHRIQYGGTKLEATDIVKLTNQERAVFDRTTVLKFNEDDKEVSIEDIAEEIIDNKDQSILVILNTKRAVNKLYEQLIKLESRKCYYLSTNMCAKHRLDVIEEIRQKIATEAIICISTQLIEAGIDLDFNQVIRSYAGIDSIVQANGRCNRECKMHRGIVKLVNVNEREEALDYLPEIKDKKRITEQILAKRHSPINLLELNYEFFERYYTNLKKNVFDYPTEKDSPTVYNQLSLNNFGVGLNSVALKQSFKTAAMQINLIEKPSIDVIVDYDSSSRRLIESLLTKIDAFETDPQSAELESIKRLLRQLQPYTVNIAQKDLMPNAIKSYLDESIRILNPAYYNFKTGIKEA